MTGKDLFSERAGKAGCFGVKLFNFMELSSQLWSITLYDFYSGILNL